MQLYIDTYEMTYPHTEDAIRKAHPDITFEVPFKSDRYLPVADTPPPNANQVTHEVRETEPQYIRGQWYRSWGVFARPKDEVTARTKEAVDALKANIVYRTQQRLDEFAATRGYSGTDSLSKYQNLTDAQIASLETEDLRAQVTKFRTECQYLALMTAVTWATLYTLMEKVLAGQSPMPTGYEDIEGDLPSLVWPIS